jgi:hypothetical protein
VEALLIVNLPARRLNQLSLSAFKPLFRTLSAPEPALLTGAFRAEFTGPSWLRKISGPGLALLGLGGWWGKTFAADGTGANLVYRKGALQRKFPIQVVLAPSVVDGKPSLAVHYTHDCPFPWPQVVDELRSLDEATLLGLTYGNAPALRGLLLPFLLHRHEPIDA